MNVGTWKIALSCLACAAFGGMACDRKPAEPVNAPPVAAAPAKGNDAQGLAEFLDKNQSPSGATASMGTNPPAGALPPGHPPIGGMAMSQPAESGMPPGHPPLGAAPPMMSQSDDGVVPLLYHAPPQWKSEAPSSPMRKAQFILPRAAGDSEDGQLVVFQFGRGQGGAVDMNIDRWVGMFTTKEGQPVGKDSVKRESREVNGLKVTIVDVAGRYADAMAAMQGAATSKDDYRLLGGIVETPDGPWFFKAVGPDATMQSHRDEFVHLFDTVKR